MPAIRRMFRRRAAVVERDLKAMQTTLVSGDDLRQAKAMLLRQIPLGEASEQKHRWRPDVARGDRLAAR